MRHRWVSLLVALGACGNSSTAPATDGGADVSPDANPRAMLRDTRYCEVLAGTLSGGIVALDVYNTIGLNDCPDAAWRALDVAALRTELAVAFVVLNGPRRWTLDAFEVGELQNPQVRTLGGIAMRLAGRIEVPLSVAMSGGAAYRIQTVRRDSTVRFDQGARVFELIDDAGFVYVMQSYSLQMQAQTLASLETLGERLRLPTAWRFRTRVLTEALRVTAVDGFASVVPDELGNTYQRTQLRP